MTKKQKLQVRDFTPADFDQVQDIYLEGINTNNATFQREKKDWQQWCSSMIESSVIVVVNEAAPHSEAVLGWAGLSSISSREVYHGIAEVSIYVAQQAIGNGVGSLLMHDLIERSEAQGYWTLQAAIFPENLGSIGLHTKYGFSVVGRRQALGKMNGVWRDVDLLERRSKVVGIF